MCAVVAAAVFGIARSVIRDWCQAEEVCQEVLLEVWLHAPRFQPGRGSAMAWVTTIAHRRAVDRVRCGAEVIEVFPTASWTRWHGQRGPRTRAAWSRQALAALRLDGVPARTNQDQRDAVAAALTARQHTQGTTETIGGIVVPLPASTPRTGIR